MNIGVTTGAAGSAAGAPLSQTAGAETERTQKDAAARQRLVEGQAKSERASGIGTAEQDEQAGERDADGRRMWEKSGGATTPAEGEGQDAEPDRRAKDPTGMSGNRLDLTG